MNFREQENQKRERVEREEKKIYKKLIHRMEKFNTISTKEFKKELIHLENAPCFGRPEFYRIFFYFILLLLFF